MCVCVCVLVGRDVIAVMQRKSTKHSPPLKILIFNHYAVGFRWQDAQFYDGSFHLNPHCSPKSDYSDLSVFSWMHVNHDTQLPSHRWCSFILYYNYISNLYRCCSWDPLSSYLKLRQIL